jgi:hypothetical protein
MLEYQGQRLTIKAATELAQEKWGELGKAKFIPYQGRNPMHYLVGVTDGKNFLTRGHSYYSFEAAFRQAQERH